ncbi:unnamed protein product, partial [Oppiella nova]
EKYYENLDQLRHELNQFISAEHRQQLNGYDILEVIKQLDDLRHDIDRSKHDNQTCHNCVSALNAAKLIIKTPDLLKSAAKTICKTSDEVDRVCVGTLNVMADPIVYILQNSKITVPEMCAILLKPDCMAHLGKAITPQVNWVLDLPKHKPFNPVSGSGRQQKMLHLTDVHLDLYYTPGSNSMCDEPMCCRSTSYGHNHSAGYWSEPAKDCDTPLNFIGESIKHMAESHKDIDLVIWTGDNAPHDSWNSSQQENLDHNKAMADLVKKSFDNKNIFPCIGNHEPHPFNMYVPEEVSIKTDKYLSLSWLYDTLADDYWSQWINTPTAKKTFKKGGYYSKQVTDGLKIVVLNNNVCISRNYWLAYDPVDPDGQLKWFIDELDSAETNGLYVMIITHMPLMYCYMSWANNYIRITERYDHIIVGTYLGHTHSDEIEVLYNKNTTTNETYPISHAYIGSSIASFSYLNPGYKVFTLDSTGRPLDFDIYYTNMTADNIAGKDVIPKWSSDKSLKSIYGLDSLSTDSWHKFLENIQTDDQLLKLYMDHLHRYSYDYEKYYLRKVKSIILFIIM